ncbi:hypothetical protein ACFWTE_25900 [Nocardiopsis sp. NPDC058631]|uniref:hypothetical protein n=1 Tax=Nocardiopsis sp. NPDC058631 TaxID=3346566 RepID=UPI0036505E7F
MWTGPLRAAEREFPRLDLHELVALLGHVTEIPPATPPEARELLLSGTVARQGGAR